MAKLSASARARKIKLIIFDVDGVLTDGKIWIFLRREGRHPALSQACWNARRSIRDRAALAA